MTRSISVTIRTIEIIILILFGFRFHVQAQYRHINSQNLSRDTSIVSPQRSASNTWFHESHLVNEMIGNSRSKLELANSTYVRQDFVFDEGYFQNLPVGIEGLTGYWWVDYNCLIRLSFLPDESSYGYTLKLDIDPYMVRVATGGILHNSDGKNEYADLGTPLIGAAIQAKTKGRLTTPTGGYWDLVEKSHGNGGKVIWTLTGSKPYGHYTLELQMWNSSSNNYVIRTFLFDFENPDVKNQQENGYIIGSGIIVSKSENMVINPDRIQFEHYAGTFKYYIDNKTPLTTENILYRQRWERVRSSNNGYGSPYNYTPEYLLLMRMKALGVDPAPVWDGNGTTTNVMGIVLGPVPASRIVNHGTKSIVTTTEFIIVPKIYQTEGSTSFGIAGTFGFHYSGIPLSVTISGSNTTTGNYVILQNPITYNFDSYPITVSNGEVTNAATPTSFVLYPNYPNPFNPSTVIRYSLPVNGVVTLKVYNMLGQNVSVLLNRQEMESGDREIEFNSASLPSGIYFYRFNVESVDDDQSITKYSDVKRMLLLK